METFPSLYVIFSKIYGAKFQNSFGKFPILGKYSLKYMGKSFTIVLENSQFWEICPKICGENFHNSFGKFSIFRKYSPKYDVESSTICRKYSTSLLGNYPQYIWQFPQILRNIPQRTLPVGIAGRPVFR